MPSAVAVRGVRRYTCHGGAPADGLPVPEVARHLDRSLRATEALLVRASTAFRRIYEGEEGSR